MLRLGLPLNTRLYYLIYLLENYLPRVFSFKLLYRKVNKLLSDWMHYIQESVFGYWMAMIEN